MNRGNSSCIAAMWPLVAKPQPSDGFAALECFYPRPPDDPEFQTRITAYSQGCGVNDAYAKGANQYVWRRADLEQGHDHS
jgi:hypothetical protein